MYIVFEHCANIVQCTFSTMNDVRTILTVVTNILYNVHDALREIEISLEDHAAHCTQCRLIKLTTYQI